MNVVAQRCDCLVDVKGKDHDVPESSKSYSLVDDALLDWGAGHLVGGNR